jgi:hypothetical protein
MEMKDKEIEYLIELGFDIKSPFDSEAVAIIMKTYLQSQNKEAKEHWDIAVNDVNRLEGEVKELREYTRHKNSCNTNHWGVNNKCTCGLDNLLKQDT